MTRELDTLTLDNAARDYAGQFLLPTMPNPHNAAFAPVGGRGWAINSLEHFTYEDEAKYFLDAIRGYLGPKALADFDYAVSKHVTPYDTDELEKELAERLAITPEGKPIPNRVGKVKQGSVAVGWTMRTHRYQWVNGEKTKVPLRRQEVQLLRVSQLAGESLEQAMERGLNEFAAQGMTVFPMATYPATMALNTRISNEAALGACDYVVDRLDEGSGAAVIQGRTGTQPADPDTGVTGTLLFTLVCSDPAFGAASDANPGGRATASAVTSDSSADATNTLAYCRASATNDGATPLDDHIDGEAGTSGADFNFNTLSIVSGATVALSSWTVTMPET